MSSFRAVASVAGICALAGAGLSMGSSLASVTLHLVDVFGPGKSYPQLGRPPLPENPEVVRPRVERPHQN